VRVVLQRVARAEVRSGADTLGRIDAGVLLLVGFAPTDADATLNWMAEKIIGLRIFNDTAGKMNLDLEEANGAVLVVSQFTLYGDATHGRRPSFGEAAPPAIAAPLFARFVALLRERSGGLSIQAGEFGAMMEVELINDGPVTLVLER
jgi:D-tyrosyl-tRNA(Tyr) deacylase